MVSNLPLHKLDQGNPEKNSAVTYRVYPQFERRDAGLWDVSQEEASTIDVDEFAVVLPGYLTRD